MHLLRYFLPALYPEHLSHVLMEIIGEIEKKSRGPYAGGVGYISFNGNLDSAITIRSAFISGSELFIQAGAGIVADSDPHCEFLETESKLGAVIASLRKCREAE